MRFLSMARQTVTAIDPPPQINHCVFTALLCSKLLLQGTLTIPRDVGGRGSQALSMSLEMSGWQHLPERWAIVILEAKTLQAAGQQGRDIALTLIAITLA